MDTNFWIFAFLLVAGSSIYIAGFSVAADLEDDGDLVFDFEEFSRDSSSHNQHDNKLVKRDTSNSHEDEHWLTHALHRIKRKASSLDLFGFFGSNKPSEEPKSSEDIVEDVVNSREKRNAKEVPENLLDSDAEVFNTIPTGDVHKSSANPRSAEYNRNQPTDDEDNLATSGNGRDDGSGEDRDPPIRIAGQPVYYRATFTVNEPYISAYSDKISAEYKEMADTLQDAVENLYFDFDGHQTAHVIKIEKRDEDIFSIKVTVDLGSVDMYDLSRLRDRLYTQLQDYHSLGHLSTSTADFTFREFEDSSTSRPSCAHDQITCRDGTCVSADARCNGAFDCPDHEDEEGCPNVHVLNEVDLDTDDEYPDYEHTTTQHSTGGQEKPATAAPDGVLPPIVTNPNDMCRGDDKLPCGGEHKNIFICEVQLCDGRKDCPGGEDEANCSHHDYGSGEPCAEYEVSCDVSRCIPQDKLCDGVPDCQDGTDEEEKACQRCRSDEFACHDGSCIADNLRCDGVANCRDRSDEHNCQTCHRSEFRCDNICIPANKRCDRNYDCVDKSDEVGCPNVCNVGDFKCDTGVCINRNLRCDGAAHCTDRSDEKGCPNRGRCQLYQFQCRDGACVDQMSKCNGITDCKDGSDEDNCTKCSRDEFRCNDGTCISISQLCDGREDCVHAEDEEHCPAKQCSSDEFTCSDGSCIDQRLRCNRQRDCPHDDSDERECASEGNTPEVNACGEGRFECADGYCIEDYKRCNGFKDCVPSGNDEEDCPPPPPETTCKSNEFRCNDGSCIPMSYRCDNTPDCPDYGDEENCSRETCREGQITCKHDGSCIDGELCNGVFECVDGSDEMGCDNVCSVDQFRCDDGTCIQEQLRCDNEPDCPDHSDENDCVSQCRDDETRCNDGVCLLRVRVCDGYPDCSDGSDEKDCNTTTPHPHTTPPPTSCEPNEFQCGNMICISENFKCDGFPDCVDNSDEEGCNGGPCTDDQFDCGTDDQFQRCIPIEKKCDGHNDCSNRYDEYDCRLPSVCSNDQFTCADGSCIPKARECDDRPDCPDRSDERHCGCKSHEFTCRSGQCVPQEAHCNRNYDCTDGSDEENCLPATTEPPAEVHCQRGQWRCKNGRQCIHEGDVCNGRVDCSDYSDEDKCDEVIVNGRSCSPGYFWCENGPCILEHLRCNGHVDCHRDNSDELDCKSYPLPPETTTSVSYSTSSVDGLDLKTYPNDQIIKERREVVFQCRDEGPIRAPVHWIRANGLPLPPNSRDRNGRLEMPNIQVDHSGDYICEAIGYPPNTRGNRVKVTLNVEPFVQPPTRPPQACGIYEATCSNGDCIAKSLVCNGKYDCTDGSDETRCNPHGCEPNEFRCANKRCVLKTWRCDHDDDCGDNSDEENCATNPPGSACKYNEFQCQSGNQCVPKAYHCDNERDCIDGTDEVGCSSVYIKVAPPPMVVLEIGELFEITCTAVGVPTPEVIWRLNWGHIRDKCTTTSINGVGTLTCPDIQERDQGAYSCEAINIKGSVFAQPDTILTIKPTGDVCPKGYFNEEAKSAHECISCFCFGATSDCKSADLFTYQLQPPFDALKYLGVRIDPVSGVIDIRDEPIYKNTQPRLNAMGRNGVHAQLVSPFGDLLQRNVVPYFTMPESYRGNQLKSYGGYLKYTLRYEGSGRPTATAPDVILTGNGYSLLHIGKEIDAYQDHEILVRFFVGEWVKRSETAPESLATREEIMMALNDVHHILIKLQYIEGHLDTTISNIEMDSAAVRNTGLGRASFVEECRCPVGYSGLSCENCDAGYSRHRSGPWLGQCFREIQECGPGTYGDPSRGIACEPCPCPLTTPENQFARTCSLGSDGQPTCDCPPGYVGRRCEQCESGYTGNPLTPGDYCQAASTCDASGANSQSLDYRGQCSCKLFTVGPSCGQCKPNTFHLSAENQFGCISCFCMGITKECTSSNWYRDRISTAFTRSISDFTLVESQRKREPIVDGIRLNQEDREIVYSEFSNRRPDVYYWALPSRYLGDKVTSYGGKLRYTLRYVPTPGGYSRNTAPDVELISSNHINLMYFSQDQRQHVGSGPQSFEVPLLEQYWQRSDGQKADREHLLMALADLEAILIKATYTTNSREAALMSVSLDIADERNSGSKERALAVEECHCPSGYEGLSCEDCAPGYTRADNGLYLGLCEPCFCNGHSNECDPETGDCLNCADHTTGPNCDMCIDGYEGNPATGTHCRINGNGPTECDCDVKGSVSNDCQFTNGSPQCQCKINVEGFHCERCRKGTFGLSQSNSEGCLKCFCSGVTNECSESNLFIEEIPGQIIDDSHGFTLVDENRNERISAGFQVNAYMSEIGYMFRPSTHQRWYWSLPDAFTGNKITSYGGRLEFVQRFVNRPDAVYTLDRDVVLTGNGITIYWTNPQKLIENVSNNVSVILSAADNWKRLDDHAGPRPASREDILIILANLNSIRIRALLSSDTASSYLADVVLETAVSQNTNKRPASLVEVCRCPPGYRGSSCELCSSGYYRDISDLRAGPLGSCNRCPCGGNEESCNLESNRVMCNCLPGYYGNSCEYTEQVSTTASTYLPPDTERPPTIHVNIRPLQFEIVEVGSKVTLHCSARSITESVPVRLHWFKKDGLIPADRGVDDNRGILVITDIRVSDSGTYICQATDGTSIVEEHYVLKVGPNNPEPPRVRIAPNYVTVNVGEPIELRCDASGNPTPTLSWTGGRDGRLNAQHSFHNGVFRIPYAQKSDEAEYQCLATNAGGTDTARAIVYVRERPEPSVRPTITPAYYTGAPGDSFTLTCRASSQGLRSLKWSRAGGVPIPYSSNERDGVLNVYNARPEDSGDYVCNVTSLSGESATERATVQISSEPSGPPVVRIEPERQTISQGTTVELRCEASGTPTPTIKWTKVGEEFGSNVQQHGAILRVSNAQVSDRGVYVCVADNDGGLAQSSTILEVERREVPILELYPSSNQKVVAGGSLLLQCRIMAGIPTPTIRWSRPNGQQLSQSIEEMNGGVLRFTHITQDEEGEYICTAENDAGKASATGHIEVQMTPKLTVLPRSGQFIIKEGEKVRFECRTTGRPQPTVQWFKPTEGLRGYGETGALKEHITNEGSHAVHEISRVSKSDEGLYICVGKNEAGTVEERVHLVVEEISYPSRGDITGEDPGSDNSITEPNYTPYSPVVDDEMSAPVGARAELRCRVPDYSGKLYLNWIRADNTSLPHESQIENGILFINDVQRSDAGEYHCMGMEPSGKVLFTAKVYLNVHESPKIHLIPPRQVVRPGDDASVQCSVTGDQPIVITWSGMGRELPTRVTVDNNGLMRFHGIQVHDAGRYMCNARNSVGSANAVAEVLVSELPTQSAPVREQKAYVGSLVHLRCDADSSGAYGGRRPVIHWSRDHYGLPMDRSRVYEDTLTLENVQIEDRGRYQCTVTTTSGQSSDYINLDVLSPDLNSRGDFDKPIEITPSNRGTARVGTPLDVNCRSNEPGVIVTWSKVGDRLPTNIRVNGGHLHISHVRPENDGVYRCEGRGHLGIHHEDYVLEVEEPEKPEPPKIITAPLGSTVVMDCNTDLEQPVTFEWNKQSGSLPRDVNVHSNKLHIPDIRGADAGTYVCTANNGRVTVNVVSILVVTGIVPYFAQAPTSYLALPTLPDAYLQFSFEISFKPETLDGLILYNGQKGNASNKDFISLALINGIPVFKFDPGSGAAVIRGDRPLHLSRWHTVKVARSRRDGTMFVDGNGPFTGQSLGKYQGLDLYEPLYIGGVPNFLQISPAVEVDTGFVGCISRLTIANVQQDLLHDYSNKVGVTTCETCSENPCQNQGVCQEALTKEGYTCLCPQGYGGHKCDKHGEACTPHTCGAGRCVDRDDGFICHCPLGKGGKHCEHDISINEPAFSDDSYIAYPTPKPQRRMKLSLKFKASDLRDGILLYCAETEEGHGDFTSIAIKDRRVEFRFDVGSGPAVLRSARDLVPNQYIAISAGRFLGDGRLTINGDPPVTGKSPGNNGKALNLNTPLYVGGVDKERITVNSGVGVAEGFRGCIAEIEVTGLSLNIIQSVTDSANIQDCSEASDGQHRDHNNEIVDNSLYLNRNGGGGNNHQYSHDNSRPIHRHETGCSSSPCRNEGHCQPLSPTTYRCVCYHGYSGIDCEIAPNLCDQLRPCQSGGTCNGTTEHYTCDCPMGYTGSNCEQRADIRNEVNFGGNGYLELSRELLSHEDNGETEVVALDLSTNYSDGLIFWHGQSPNEDGQGQDYIALAMVGGYLEFSFDLGSGPAIISNRHVRVNDGQRHSVILKRTGTEGSIEIDRDNIETGAAEGMLSTLNCNGNIYLGGTPNIPLMTGGRFTNGFNGCIHGFELQDSNTIDLGVKAKSGVNVKPCASSDDDNEVEDDGEDIVQ